MSFTNFQIQFLKKDLTAGEVAFILMVITLITWLSRFKAAANQNEQACILGTLAFSKPCSDLYYERALTSS